MTFRIGDTTFSFSDLTLHDGDHPPDEWTNLMYMVPALVLPTAGAIGAAPWSWVLILSALALAGSQVLLTVMSWHFHDAHTLSSQRADEWGVGVSIAAVACVAWAFVVTPWALIVLPIWTEFYRRQLHRVSISYTVAGWTLFTIMPLVGAARWWTLLPILLLFGALSARYRPSVASHGWRHALWHILSATAEATVVAIVLL